MNFVSVVIPSYNRCQFLAKAIESVLSQKYPHFEVIVVDDGSSDDTAEMIAREYMSKVRYLALPHKGVSHARNRGIEASRYELIAFLDSDDAWKPDKLGLQVEVMTQSPQYLLSHTEEVWFRSGKILNQKNKHRKEGGDLFLRSLELCVIGMSTVMVRKELFDKIGLFDETFPACEDYDLWLRMTCRYPVCHIPQVLTIKHGGHADQLSKIHMGMDRFRIRSIEQLLQNKCLNSNQIRQARAELGKKCRIYAEGCAKRGKTEEAKRYFEMMTQC